MSDTDIGVLLIVLGALWRVFGASERPQEMFDLKYSSQKEQLLAGTPFKKYSRQLAFWQSVFQVKTAQVEDSLAETMLSLTTETDLVVLRCFEEPSKAVAIYEHAAKDLTLMFRSLSKREELECEKVARTLLRAGMFFEDEERALRDMATFGPSNVAMGDKYSPPTPLGQAPSTWLAKCTERVAYLKQDRDAFIRVRGEETARQLAADSRTLTTQEKTSERPFVFHPQTRPL